MPKNNNSSITIRDVASRADVSVATVSRFINGTAPVSSVVAHRIEVVMKELKYTPHAAARQLATNKTMNIGLLLTNMHNDFFAPLLSGIEELVSEKGYNLLVGTCKPDRINSLPIGPHNADGLLVFADSVSDDMLRNLVDRRYPLVLIHRTSPEDLHIPSVTVENKDATRALVEHMIVEHDRKRIVFMAGLENQEDSYWRQLGYLSALEKHGISFDSKLVLHGGFERDVAFKSMSEYLSENPQLDFDAVFTGDDDAGVGVIDALIEHGIRIPEDVSVAGFDDSRMSAYLSPPLTTVKAPTSQVGRVATEQLFKLLRDDNSEITEVTLLPTEIIIRKSCGCNRVTGVKK